MKITVTETHEREVVAYFGSAELARLVAAHVADAHEVDLGGEGVSYKVDFPDETAESPVYTVETGAKVRITVKLGGEE